MNISKVTYEVKLAEDLIAEKLSQGWTEQEIKANIEQMGIHSPYVIDRFVVEVS